MTSESQRAIVGSARSCMEEMLKVIKDHKKQMLGQVRCIDARINGVEKIAKAANLKSFDPQASEHIENLKQELDDLRLTLDSVDNRTRARNAVVYGAKDQEAMESVQELLVHGHGGFCG